MKCHIVSATVTQICTIDTFDCKDQPIAICCGNDHLWSLLSHSLGHDEWVNQPNFKTNDLREKNWQEVKNAMQAVLKTKNAAEWDKSYMKLVFLQD